MKESKEVDFTIVLKDGSRLDHSCFVDKDLNDIEKIKRKCLESVYDDRLWVEINQIF